jgi:hypothetical protein
LTQWWRWIALRLGFALLSFVLWWGKGVVQAHFVALDVLERTANQYVKELHEAQQRLALVEFEARMLRYRHDRLWQMINRVHPGLLTDTPEL